MIGEKMLAAMNEQIKNEFESAYIYLSMVAYFADQGLDGMAQWMRCQTQEEMVHAMKLYDHILERGGTVTLLDLKQLKTAWSSPQEAWDDALKHEQFITGKINDLMKLAIKEDDFASMPLLNWFVEEQIEEEDNASKNSQQMKLAGSSGHGLLMLDRELGARVFVYPPAVSGGK